MSEIKAQYTAPRHGGPHVLEFGSVSDAIETAFAVGRGSNRESVAYADAQVARNDGGGLGTQWVNGATSAAVKQWISRPPAGVVAAVANMRERIEEAVEPPTRKRRKRRFGQEDGEELDPQRVVERRTDAWELHERVRVHAVAVRVLVNVGVHCGRRPEDLLYRGAAAAVMCDVLTGLGCSVEIVAGFYSSRLCRDKSDGVASVLVKRMDAPLDIASVAVCLAEIGFFRAVVLPAVARSMPVAVAEGMGSVRPLGGVGEVGRHDVTFESDILDEESAVRRVLEHAETVRKEISNAK